MVSTANRLDEIDQKIIGRLQEDARKSARALARDIKMAPGTVSERISRLERAGVIKGYHAEMDPVGVGISLQVIIGLQVQQEPSLAEIVKELLKIPEIVAVHVVSGQWHLVVI